MLILPRQIFKKNDTFGLLLPFNLNIKKLVSNKDLQKNIYLHHTT